MFAWAVISLWTDAAALQEKHQSRYGAQTGAAAIPFDEQCVMLVCLRWRERGLPFWSGSRQTHENGPYSKFRTGNLTVRYKPNRFLSIWVNLLVAEFCAMLCFVAVESLRCFCTSESSGIVCVHWNPLHSDPPAGAFVSLPSVFSQWHLHALPSLLETCTHSSCLHFTSFCVFVKSFFRGKIRA